MFASKEIAALCNIPEATINRWVRDGFIKPAHRGHAGRGRTHAYSPQQAFAFALLGDMLKIEFSGIGTRLGRIQVMNVFRRCSKISDDDLRRWVGVGIDDFDEEAMSANERMNALSPFDWREVPEGMGERVERVWNEVRRRLLTGQKGRIAILSYIARMQEQDAASKTKGAKQQPDAAK
jgi:hypothetical protein